MAIITEKEFVTKTNIWRNDIDGVVKENVPKAPEISIS